MEAWTPAERRGALLVAVLLALGAGHDLWRATRPLPVARDHGSAPPVAADRAIAAAPDAGPVALDGGRPLDLNRASARELDALPGVGPVLAARIIAQREQQGGFRRIEELMAVRGIGPRVYQRLKSRVAVVSAGPVPASHPAAADTAAGR